MSGMAVLQIAYDELDQELQRIERFIKEDNPFLEKASDLLWKKFNGTVTDVQSALDQLREVLFFTKPFDSKKAWELYAKIKVRLLPQLSNELLAVVGGIVMQINGKDYIFRIDKNLSDDSIEAEKRKNIPFTLAAQELIKEVQDFSTWGWDSVLIVGEEPLSYNQPEIIRLRYPACDLWNLPFVVHEYGYRIALKKFPHKFEKFSLDMKISIEGEKHTPGNRPEHAKIYLKEISGEHGLWEQYDKYAGESGLESFLNINQERIKSLSDKQEAFICRLFADAFGAYVVGPAYLYALIYLKFVPDDTLLQPTAMMPPFFLRYIFALKALERLQNKVEQLSYKKGEYKKYIEANVADPESIPILWKETLLSSPPVLDELNQIIVWNDEEISKRYNDLINQYSELLKIVLDDISTRIKIYDVFMEHKRSQTLIEEFNKPTASSPAKKTAIISACWELRHIKTRNRIEELLREREKKEIDLLGANKKFFEDVPGDTSNIEGTFLKLLQQPYEQSKPEIPKASFGISGRRIEPQDYSKTDEQSKVAKTLTPDQKENCIRVIQEALSSNEELWEKFASMKKTDEFTMDKDINRYLSSHEDDAFRKYQQLIRSQQQLPGKASDTIEY